MPKYFHGDKVTDLSLRSAKGAILNVPNRTTKFTHLMFRRWIGCPICNIHMASFGRQFERLVQADIRTLVFFASTPEEIYDSGVEFPFEIVADSAQVHYRAFGVGKSLFANFHWKSIYAMTRGLLRGKGHAQPIRRLDGLPADILLRSDGVVVDAYYGDHPDDGWNVDILVATAASLGKPPVT